MYEYTRSDYLKALLNQKKQLNANSNSLVNPATPQADNIADLATLDTSFSGTSSTPTPEQTTTDTTDRNWWQRTLDTVTEFNMNVSEGILGFVGGIVDAGGYIYGAISGDHAGAQDFMNYDWEAQALNVLNQLDGNNIFSGDIFTSDYWNDWADIGSASASRENINNLHQGSWTAEMGAEGQQMYNQITQGIGSALPSIALGILTGGSSALVKGLATMGTMGVSGFGAGASEALNDGANYGQAAGYGAISAGIEMLTEIGSDLLGGLISGKGVSKIVVNGVEIGAKEAVEQATKKGFKEIAKDTIKNMLSEGTEEAVSTLLNPIAKVVTYKGEDGWKEYSWDLVVEAGISFASGAIGGAVGSNVSRKHMIAKYGEKGVAALEALNNANENEKAFAKKALKGGKNGNIDTLAQEYGIEYSSNIKKAVKLIQEMQQTNTEHFNNLMKAITGVKSKTTTIEEYNEMFEYGLKPRVDETITQRYAKNIGSRIGVDINLVEDSMLQSAEAFMKATGIKLTEEQIQQFNDPESIQHGLNVDGKVYISDAYQNDINQLIMHEAVSHGYLDSNQDLRDSFLNSLRTNKEFRAKLKDISADVYKLYGLNQQQVQRIFDPKDIKTNIKVISNETMHSETMAKFMEFLYSNNDISSVLNTLNKSKLSSMLSRAIKYLGTKGDGTKQARLQLEKILSKIKSTKGTVKTEGTNKNVKFKKQTANYINKDDIPRKVKNEIYNQLEKYYNKTNETIVNHFVALVDNTLYIVDSGISENNDIDFGVREEIEFGSHLSKETMVKIKEWIENDIATKGRISKELREQPRRISYSLDRSSSSGGNSEQSSTVNTKQSKSDPKPIQKATGNREGINYDNEFRRIQETSRGMSTEEIQMYHSGLKTLDEGLRGRLSNSVKRILMESRGNGTSNANGVLKLSAKGNTFKVYQNIDSKLFHDVFEIARNYLRFGELVDLHPIKSDEWNTGYEDCTCYLSEDGLSGFAITKTGDLISVFNASGKSGFLRAIAPVVKENALTLDCFASINQDLETIYESIFNFTTASIMDYNMEYDHDDIAKNHQMPQVAFMVNATKVAGVELQHFNKDQYDEAQEHQLSYTKNIKFAKAKATNTASTTTQTTTNTPVQAKSTVYSDFFNQDGTINAEWVKRGARANYGNMIGLKDSKFIIDVALETITNNISLGAKIDLKEINVVAREFFEQYNVSDGDILRSKAYNTLLDKLLSAKITYDTEIIIDETTKQSKTITETTTLEEYISKVGSISGYANIDEFRTEITALINDMIKNYGKPTKMQLAYNKFNARLKATTERLLEYVHTTTENVRLTYETAKLVDKIQKYYDDHKIKSHLGVLIPELTFIRDLAKGIRPYKNSKTISASSIDNIIKHFEQIKYEPNSETLEKLGLEFKQEWYDMYDYFKKKQNLDKDGNLKFPKRALTLEETQMINSFIKDLNKTINNYISNREIEIRQSFSKATTNINVVLNRTDTNKPTTNFVKRELDYVTSPDVMLREMFGFNSEVVKICYDDLVHAYIQQQGTAQKFWDEYTELAKNLKGKSKLSHKVEMNWNGTKYTVENDILVDIYLQSLATENRQALVTNGYTFDYKGKSRTVKFTDEMLLELENKLTPELKDFAHKVLDYYNNELKTYAKAHGIEVLENAIYYPRSRSDVTNTQVDSIMQQFRALNPDTLPINQQRKNNVKKALGGMGASVRIKYYINQVTKIGEMTEALEKYNKFLNTKVTDENGNKVSRNELIKHINSDWTIWKSYIENQVAGIPVSKEVKASGLFQNLVASTLGWNVSTVLKQTASIPTIMTNVHFTSWLKGLSGVGNIAKYKKIKETLMNDSPLLYKRFSDNQAVLAQGFTKQLGEAGKFFMKPVEGMDEAIILTFCYQTAQYEAQLLHGYKVGTKENHKAAIQILEKIVLNTQSNAVAPKMSMARSGAGGYVRKALSYFTSDLNNIINITREVISARSIAKKNIASIEEMITKTQQELDNTTDVEEKERLQLELDNLNKLLEENKVNADFNKKWKEVVKLLLVLALKGLTIAGVGQLVDRLYGRKAWDENTIDEFAMDLLLESTIYNIPYVQTFINAKQYDQPIGGFDFTLINDTLNLYKEVTEELRKDNPNLYSVAYKFATTIGQFTGIPFKNIYNIIMGVWKNLDPSGHEWDGIIKGYSDTYILQQYKEATSVGRTYQAKGYFDILMKNNKVSTYSTKVQNEIVSLSKDGYNCLPKNYMLGYVDDKGKQVQLTEEQIQMFRTAYNNSNSAVEGLLEISEYKSSTQEEKAKYIKKIYDLYYSYARAKTLKQNKADNKLSTLLLYTNGKANVSKYVGVLNTISSIKESKTKSRKELVIEYVNKLRGYSKQEKLLILHLAGYKTNENNLGLLSSYLRNNGMNIKDVKQFLGVE